MHSKKFILNKNVILLRIPYDRVRILNEDFYFVYLKS